MTCALLAPFPPQRKAFFAVETLRAFMVDQPAFSSQQGMQTWGAEFAPLFCKLSQAGPDFVIVLWLRLVPATAPAQPDNGAGPSFAELMVFFEVSNHAPPGGRRYHFFERTSLMARFSSMASASICFSFLFSV
jgi:hypothetical protein